MRPSRIEALGRVTLEAIPERADALRGFYGELLRLDELDAGSQDAGVLRFGSSRIELTIHLTESPDIDRLNSRLVLSVASLRRMREELEERSIRFRRQRGLTWTDRRLVLFDPAGNRIELKQEWPPVY